MRDQGGFTLVEVLIALSLGGLIIGSVFRIVSGYTRFVEMESARVEVQQNARAAFEMIAGEMRSLGPGEGLVRADRDSITLRVPRVRGVIGGICPDGRPVVVFPATGEAGFGVNLGLGMEVHGSGESRAARVLEISPPGARCGVETAPGNELRMLTLESPADMEFSLPWMVPGDLVSLSEMVTYRTGSSAGVPGRWILRRVGSGPGATNQPFAGPIASGEDGFRLEYFGGESVLPLPVPVEDREVRARVNRVAVIVEWVSRYGSGDQQISRVDTIVVPLRNQD
ncbi:MAG: type II secretion system GspH family protein [Gemmatimonadota bacterium]|nr:type II secretion system GspH family protein [Gemmatimonadota bacterium]